MTDYELVLMCAIRYALGRRTYIVGVIVDYIIQELPQLGKNCIDNIIRDIDNTEDLGDECDISQWNRLRELILIERKRRFGPYTS